MKFFKAFGLVAALVALFAVAVPGMAQETPAPTPATPGTITVYGSGSAFSAPDQATLELGVDVFTTDVASAFTSASDTVRTIVDALIALGVAQEDIQTTNLNIYSSSRYNPETGDEVGYQVGNTVRIMVRDISLIGDIIDAGIANGATSLYGLTFSVSDSAPLESAAREQAVAQARNRATELAGLVGATIGNVVSISEDAGGVSPMAFDMARSQSGGGGTFVTPGQSSVSVGVSVTFELVR